MTQVQIPLCGCTGENPKCDEGKRLRGRVVELSGQIERLVEGDGYDAVKYERLLSDFHVAGDAFLAHILRKPVERYQ